MTAAFASFEHDHACREDSGVCVHTASPGMVTTDLLMREATPGAKRIFNILAEHPETTAKWLVPRLRAIHLSERPSSKNG